MYAISLDITWEVAVTDILIRDVPDDLVADIDAHAKRLGLSRTAYLRRTLERERRHSVGPVTAGSFDRLARLAVDLEDRGVMSDAWR